MTSRVPRRALPRILPPPAVIRAAERLRHGLLRGHRASSLPLVTLLEQTIGMVEVQATTAFVELGLADAMGDKRLRSNDLAAAVEADASAVDRLLSLLATSGLVARRRDRWRLTASGELLRSDHPDSIRDWVLFIGSSWQLRAWEHLAEGIREPSTTPYERAHGANFFDDLAARPERGAAFDQAMRSTSRLQGDLLARALDLSNVLEICDVGGGTGSVLIRLLEHHPHVTGRLIDLPAVIERSGPVIAEAGMANRIQAETGDMFTSVPAGADRYLLSAILHDWSDQDALRILVSVRRALTKPGAMAVVVELELPAHDGAALARAYDLLMLTLGGGRERGRADFEALYAKAGLRLDQDLILGNGWHAHHLAPDEVGPGGV